MSQADPVLPRLRQAVVAARELAPVRDRLREELGLGEPFSDPGVEYFGLHNVVFALGDTFLEVISPLRDGTAAGRLLDRRGGDCGYMLMFQVAELAAARARAAEEGVRDVFEVELDDIAEVHLHPADMRAAIVSLSTPRPPSAWRWGGPEWEQRSAPVRIVGARVAVADPGAVGQRWARVLGGPVESAGVEVVADEAEPGLIEVVVAGGAPGRGPIEVGGVRFSFLGQEEVCSERSRFDRSRLRRGGADLESP